MGASGRLPLGGRGGKSGRGRGRSGGGGGAPQDATVDDCGTMNANLVERFNGNVPRAHSAPDFGSNATLNTDIKKYVTAQNIVFSTAAPESWLSLPEIPLNSEVSSMVSEVTLAANKMKGRWKSTDKYLKAHYELLREDAVSPLREAVEVFRQNPSMDDNHNVAVYEKVHIAGLTFAHLGIAVRIKFSTVRAGRKILWGSSKRLTSGTIVALTPSKDKFSSKCIVAVVAARPLQGVELIPSEIDIYFAHAENMEIDPQEEWLMIEARTGYFEAYRHTLRALQKLSQETFPLSEHICSLLTEVAPPEYVRRNASISLSAVAVDKAHESTLRNINILEQWPASAGDALDSTQWDAMQQILTKRLSIIQGPPGTGKTHVSKLALQVLVENKQPNDPPVIIAAQTNHALDQLLGHVSKFDPNYIRLGGRSTNAEVKQRALYEVRQKERIPMIPGSKLGQANSALRAQTNKILGIVEPLSRASKEPFSAKLLRHLAIITDAQCQSLEGGAAQWVSSEESQESSMKLWLTKALIQFEVVYKQDNFGFEEADEDLEFEQLKEQEAENGVADEEDIELLKGQWCHLEDRYTVQRPSAGVLDKAKKQLDTVQDLWKVPEYLRGPMYSVMQAKAKTAIVVQFRDAALEYQQIVQDLKVGKWERDAVFLRRSNIIGMTTTGLSKYRPLIASLKPKIILIEEAAEVIEAPITVACVESIEHLILVGDHQQLQGHCSVSELEGEPYHLNVSMFERLVKNGMPFKTLLCQRRMDPEFCRLLMPIYPHLQDHHAVKGREYLPGGLGGKKSFFFDHEFLEMKDSQLSTFNDKEAEFVAEFYKYLLKNGATLSGITILTFYNGQRKRILKYLRDDPMTRECYNNVKTVDSYQGEENTIIILSLVRSNDRNKIGFLEIDNRVSVALSRAQFGFYLFGNARSLVSASTLWNSVITTMSQEPLRIGCQLPIMCTKHGHTKLMAYPEDWYGNDGGCDQLCQEHLPCGHLCDLKCHPYPHEKLRCLGVCDRKLICGHTCKNKCHEECGCDCQDFSKPASWKDGFLGGKEPSQNSQYPPSPGNGGQAWEGSGATRSSSGPMGVRGNNDYTSTVGHQRASGFSTGMNKRQGFAVPSRSKAEEMDDTFLTTTKQSMGPLGAIHEPRMSSSSLGSTFVRSQSNTTYYQSYGHVSQHSSDKQDESIQGWAGFANGGVKKHDAAIVVDCDEKMKEVVQPLIDLELSDSSPVKRETVQEMRGGRKIFKQEYRPSGGNARYIGFGLGELGRTDGASSTRINPEKGGWLEEINLLD